MKMRWIRIMGQTMDDLLAIGARMPRDLGVSVQQPERRLTTRRSDSGKEVMSHAL